MRPVCHLARRCFDQFLAIPSVNWESKVFPVDTGSDEIRADPFCLELPFRHVEHMARQDEDGNLCIDIGYSVDKV